MSKETQKVIDWDKYSLIINGERVFLIGGEFHYWRAPDKERWLDILRSYKSAGLNCLRIYFHWGFHQPEEDVFNFSGNRDVNYLLELCEQLGFYVFIASGPYICAETNAGGFPLWLLQKRDIRIRHMKKTLVQKYDEEYLRYCELWQDRFIKEIKSHQITENPNGCVIGFQLENEYFEKIAILKTYKQYMEHLKQNALDNGITVPLFHNDVWESNAWNGLVDLYGYDKYTIHADKSPESLPLAPWNPKEFDKKNKNSEKKIQKFGPPASETPMFIPELQGGWYNHWGVPYGYDELYNFYGETYQKVILQSVASQRVTMMVLYMLYGGTNYGTIANPEVYTSYDYSAGIREFGYQSNRLRQIKLFTYFARSFNDSLSQTEPEEKPDIKCRGKDIVYKLRTSTDGTKFYFFRNFNKKGIQRVNVTLEDETLIPKGEKFFLRKRDGFIAVANHEMDGFKIKFSAIPILLKQKYNDGTLLVLIQNGGELLLEGKGFKTEGYMNYVQEDGFARFSFVREGADTITSESGEKLYVVCLSEEKALTVDCDFESEEFKMIYGAYSSYFGDDKKIHIETTGKQDVTLLCCEDKVPGFKNLEDSRVPGMKFHYFGSDEEEIANSIPLEKWSVLKTDWCKSEEDVWLDIDFKTERDPLDHGYFGANTLYKCEFNPGNPKNLELNVNARHIASVWLNGKFLGKFSNYVTETFNVFKAGPMNGPDPTYLGKKEFDLKPYITPDAINTLFVLTESLGQNKNFLPFCDSRNPRGILSAKVSKKPLESKWSISGIEVKKLEDPYNSSGLPGETLGYHKGEGTGWTDIESPKLEENDQIVWFKSQFNVNKREDVRIPLRLHIEGIFDANIFLNGNFIGRYWGERGPQNDFYLMDNFVKAENSLVIAAWNGESEEIKAEIKPYMIEKSSGNIKEDGEIFSTKKHVIDPVIKPY